MGGGSGVVMCDEVWEGKMMAERRKKKRFPLRVRLHWHLPSWDDWQMRNEDGRCMETPSTHMRAHTVFFPLGCLRISLG